MKVQVDVFDLKMHITAIFATALLAASNVAAGINCKGSVLCGQGTEPLSNLINYAGGLNDDRWYQNGQHIVCGGSLCAFLQNTGGLPGRNIKGLLGDLRDHGCKYCGSVPVFFPDDNNDGDHGILTVNYVSNPNCQGVC
ncbi:KP4 killer toxin [Fusarium mexicanum]|uniref:KP4 killer toxin n=1 Tax=Fusarium mexicanum TaxID=751941 RepID=A0A8H5IAR5_9HYPO|nr:KP4 killer toxin [Fusarium mexicanum]